MDVVLKPPQIHEEPLVLLTLEGLFQMIHSHKRNHHHQHLFELDLVLELVPLRLFLIYC